MTYETNTSTLKGSTEAERQTKAPVRLPRKRLSRDERVGEVREAIFRAAAKVVGRYGYADASINRITAAAGIAQGTFYLYFESRQALFDELLPHFGADMLNFIRARVLGAKDVFDAEERGFRALFEFLKSSPGFTRILNEAEAAAPAAHRKHFQMLTQHYVASLQRGIDAGQIQHFDRDELETLAYIFMAARSYLYLRYLKTSRGRSQLPESVVQTYMKLVRGGLR